MDDPYKLLIETMRREGKLYNPPSVMIGEVTSQLPDLYIMINGIQLDRSDIKVADYLVNSLNAGDEVVVIPLEDKSKFIVLCRVVSI